MADVVELETLVTRFTSDTTNLEDGLRRVKKGHADLVNEAAKSARQMEVLHHSINEVGKGLAGILQRIGAALNAIDIGTFAVRLQAQAESTQISFGVMLKSAEKGKQMFEDLANMAARTPFELTGLSEAAKTLLQFNIAGSDVIPMLERLGNIAGGNSQRLQSLALAFGQMSSTGRLMGQDLLQMVNAGFNPLLEMAEQATEQLGGSMPAHMARLRVEMEHGMITVQDVRNAFERASAEGGRFFQHNEKMAKSLSGLFSNLRDDIAATLRDIGKAIEETFMLKEITAALSTISQQIKAFFAGMDPELKFLLMWAARITGALMVLVGAGTIIRAVFAPLIALFTYTLTASFTIATGGLTRLTTGFFAGKAAVDAQTAALAANTAAAMSNASANMIAGMSAAGRTAAGLGPPTAVPVGSPAGVGALGRAGQVLAVGAAAYAGFEVGTAITSQFSSVQDFNAQMQRAGQQQTQMAGLSTTAHSDTMAELASIGDPEKRVTAAKEAIDRQTTEMAGLQNTINANQRHSDSLRPTWRSLWQSGRAVWNESVANVTAQREQMRGMQTRLTELRREQEKAEEEAGKGATPQIEKLRIKLRGEMATAGMGQSDRELFSLAELASRSAVAPVIAAARAYGIAEDQLEALRLQLIDDFRMNNTEMQALNRQAADVQHRQATEGITADAAKRRAALNEEIALVDRLPHEADAYRLAWREVMAEVERDARRHGATERELNEIRAQGLNAEQQADVLRRANSTFAGVTVANIAANQARLTTQTRDTTHAMEDQAAALRYQAENVDAGAQAYRVFEMTLAAARLQVQYTAEQLRQLRATGREQDTAAAGLETANLVKTMEVQAEVMNYNLRNISATNNELKVYEMRVRQAREATEGLTAAERAARMAQLEQLQQLARYAAAQDVARQALERFQLPIEKYMVQAQRLADAWASGLFRGDQRAFQMAMQEITRDLQDGAAAAGGFQHAMAGSAEAMARFAAYESRQRVRISPGGVIGQNLGGLDRQAIANRQGDIINELMLGPRLEAAQRRAAINAVIHFIPDLDIVRAALDAVLGPLQNSPKIHFVPDLFDVQRALRDLLEPLEASPKIHFVPDLEVVQDAVDTLADDLGHSIKVHFVPDMYDVEQAVKQVDAMGSHTSSAFIDELVGAAAVAPMLQMSAGYDYRQSLPFGGYRIAPLSPEVSSSRSSISSPGSSSRSSISGPGNAVENLLQQIYVRMGDVATSNKAMAEKPDLDLEAVEF